MADDFLSIPDSAFSRGDFCLYLEEVQSKTKLRYHELSLLVPALELSALLSLSTVCDGPRKPTGSIPTGALRSALSALAFATSLDAEKIVADLLGFEAILLKDPAQIYPTLDPNTKNIYRAAVDRLSESSGLDEEVICESALALSRQEEIATDARLRLRSHVGYYLIDDGFANLAGRLGIASTRRTVLGVQRSVGNFLIFYACLALASTATSSVLCLTHAHFFFLLQVITVFALGVVASRLALVLASVGASVFLSPSRLPRINFEKGIPDEYATILAIPCLLLNMDQLTSAVKFMKNHYDTFREKNLSVVLMTDLPDSVDPTADGPSAFLLECCSTLVCHLNDLPEYSTSRPFFLLHREPIFCETQRSWMGWERKRGKLQSLISDVVSGSNHFVALVGEVERLYRAKYLVVLDEDSRLFDGTVQALVGTLAHPLNHPHVDLEKRLLVRGYGILQPTLVNADATDRMRTEPERPAVRRNLYQDALGESQFLGKGIIDMAAYHALLQGVIPEQRVLSHDAVESAILRTGAVTDATLLESPPSTYALFCNRQHRWLRGDWQNLIWLLSRSPKDAGKVSLFGKFRIVDCIRDSLLPVPLTSLLLVGVASNLQVLVWTFLMMFGPIYAACGIGLIVALRSQRKQLRQATQNILGISGWIFLYISNLPHQAAISIDAAARTMVRFMTGRRLLEWETAAYSEQNKKAISIFDVYQWVVVLISIAVALALIRGANPRKDLIGLLLMWSAAPALRAFLAQRKSVDGRRMIDALHS